MRIAIDARMLRHSGIGRYLSELIRCWSDSARISDLVAFGSPLPADDGVSGAVRYRVKRYGAPVYSIREQIIGPWVLRRWRSLWDVAFFPHFNAPFMCPTPYVITIHDLIHLRYPELFGRARIEALKVLLPRVAKRAARIITVSAATKSDVASILPEVADRVCVVPHGVSSTFQVMPSQEVVRRLEGLGLVRPYILFVGNFKAFKNLATLVRAFAHLSTEFPDLDLLLVGQPFPEHDRVRAIIRAERITHRVRELVGTSDRELVSLLNGARVVVQPSHIEGFGLPVVEAMACGAPVIASDTPALREVAGDAALIYGAPTDVDALALAMRSVLSEATLAANLIARGRSHVAGLTWEAAAEAVLKVLCDALSVCGAARG